VAGYEILVGRGSEDNDYLTFEVAEPADVWLHVGGGTPGSHVVVRNPEGGDLPQDVLLAAAGLAAWYSKARGAPKVEVSYCRASNVSKPRGAPAGLVEITKHKTIRVVPALPEGTPDA
jgi:predicted ribosome quality control (RQC) complex YloA/Tae2 family protein